MFISLQKKEEGLITRYPIVGSRRLSNYWWSIVIFLGGCGFLFTGLSSFFNRNLLVIPPKVEFTTQVNKDKFISASNLVFFPLETNESHSIFQKGVVLADTCEARRVRSKHCKSKMLPVYPLPATQGTEVQLRYGAAGEQESVKKQMLMKFILLPFSKTELLCKAKGMEKQIGDVINLESFLILGRISIFNEVPIFPFFPQGLVLSFYGFLGVAFSFHLLFTLFWEIGGGFNEVNKKEKSIRIFRWGRPGKNRRIDLKYSNELMDAIKIELSPKPALFLCLKGDKKIPLTRIGELLPLEDLETQAAELTSLLQVPLEIADS